VSDRVEIVILGGLWIAVLSRLWSGRAGRSAWQMKVTMVAGAVVCTLDLPPLLRGIDHATGIDNLGSLLQQVVAVAGAAAGLGAVGRIGGSEVRGRLAAITWGACAVAVAAMVGLFAVAPVHHQPIDPQRYIDFTVQDAGQPAVLAYWLVFAGYLGVVFSFLARSTLGYARDAPSRAVRWSMLGLSAGSALILTYVVSGSVVVLLRATGTSDGLIEVNPIMTRAEVLLLAVVFAAAFAILSVERSSQRVRAYLALQHLRPLWRDFAEPYDDIVLERPRRRDDLLAWRDVDLRLYRRVIEICDGYRAVRRFAVDETPMTTPPSGRRPRIGDHLVNEAVALYRARLLRAMAAPFPASRRPAILSPVPTPPQAPEPGSPLAAELARLQAHARARRYARTRAAVAVRLTAPASPA
jgi:hypothetical protein